MAAGRIKFWNGDRGFGFIIPDSGGADVFLHVRELRQSARVDSLPEGTKVTFDTEPGKDGKGPKAINIKVAR